MRISNEVKDSLLTSVSSVNQSINKFLVQSVEEESVSESSSRMSKRPTYKSKRYNVGQNKFKDSDSTLSRSKVEETKQEAGSATHTVIDHGGNKVEVPNKIERIVVSDIFPIPAVLSVFFNSADKIVSFFIRFAL